MFGTGSKEVVLLPWNGAQLTASWRRIERIIQTEPEPTPDHMLVYALLAMSAQGELKGGAGGGTVRDVVEFVHSHFAPLMPSKAHGLVPEQRRWPEFVWSQWEVRVPRLVRVLGSDDPMRVFDLR